MKRFFSGIIGCFLSISALAWDATGHEVVARIAWGNLKPATQQNIIALLKNAPTDADLASLLPEDSRQKRVREREMFLLASTWPDIVKDRNHPERRNRYNHSNWHYINYFWKQNETGQPEDIPTMQPEEQNVLERLKWIEASITDGSHDDAQKAIDTAWIFHLVGDIHQPLHCTARVTDTEPRGDQGGNLFKLDSKNRNLHSYWDGILTDSYPRKSAETLDAYINRLAGYIVYRYPKSKMLAQLKPGQFEEWAKEGFDTCKSTLYPTTLLRDQAPDKEYQKTTLQTAKFRIALAGYRLAALLEKLFGTD